MRYDAASLIAEHSNARSILATRSQGVQEIVQQMAAGLSLNRKGDEHVRNIENHYHEYIAYIRPRIAGGAARVEVETPRGGPARVEAAAGEAAVNQWIEDTRHANLTRKLSTDFLLGWGVGGLRLDRLPGQESDDYHTVPVGFRIEREDAFWDVSSTSWENRQFAGFDYTIGKYDLIERAEKEDGWDMQAVYELPVDLDGADGPSRASGTVPRRDECVVREIWCPRVLSDSAPKWATGTIFTLGGGGKGFLREPRPFFGPPWGPIYLFDAYYIPGQSLGAAPCELVREQVEELNRHANALSRSTAQRRKISVAGLIDKEDAVKFFTTPDGALCLLNNFKKDSWAEWEHGGATAEQRTALAELKQRLKHASGLDDAQTGAVSGVGTATENAIAAESAGVRVGDLADRFASCDELFLSGVLWYVMHTKSLRVKLRPEAVGVPAEAAPMVEITAKGGMRPGLAWSDFRLRVQKYSVGRESDAARRARIGRAVQGGLGIATVSANVAPFTDVRMLLRLLGEAENVPEIEYLVDPDAAAALFGAEAGAQSEEPDASLAPDAETPRPKVAPERGNSAGKAMKGKAA